MMNAELTYSHNRDMLLLLVRHLPDDERLEAEQRVMGMQVAFDTTLEKVDRPT